MKFKGVCICAQSILAERHTVAEICATDFQKNLIPYGFSSKYFLLNTEVILRFTCWGTEV